MKKVPLTMQMQSTENGPANLHMILSWYGKFLPISEVRDHMPASRNAIKIKQFCDAAAYFGLETKIIKNYTLDDLKGMKFPLVIHDGHHYYVLKSIKRGKVYINDSYRGSVKMTLDAFLIKMAGTAIELTPSSAFVQEGKPVSSWQVIKKRIDVYKKESFQILFCNIILAVVSTFSLALSSTMMDKVINGSEQSLWLPLIIAMSLILLLRIFVSVTLIFNILSVSRISSADSGSKMYKTVLNLPMIFYESHFAGDIVNRITANMKIDQTFLRTILPSIINIAVAVIYLIMMYLCEPIFAAVFTGIELLYVLVSVGIRSKTGVITQSIVSAENTISNSTLNGMNMIETIKTSGAERNYFNAWTQSQNDYDNSRYQLVRLEAVSSGLSSLHTSLTAGLLLFFGAYLIIHGQLTLGVYSILESLMKTLQRNLNSGVKLSGDIQKMRTDIERADDILERETETIVPLNEDPYKLNGDISIKHLYFRYSSADDYIIKDFNLDIAQGETIALVGHTGCGKSTVIKMLTGLYHPDSGEILINGRPIEEIPTDILRTSIATVDQESISFNDTIGENIRLWDETISDYTLVQATRDAEIYDSIVERHGGFETEMRENGRNFSGGELQRMEIARSLTMEPTIMILDEFTSALDVVTEKKVFDAIISRGVTSVMAVHRLSSIMKCDRVVVMDKGVIVEMGDPHTLYEQDGAFARLVGKGKVAS